MHSGKGAVFFTTFFSFPLLIIIPSSFHSHQLLLHEVCGSSDQAAHYHALDPKSGTSPLIQHLALSQGEGGLHFI
jgi:hypothetical protein